MKSWPASALTLAMIWQLHEKFGIPAESLIRLTKPAAVENSPVATRVRQVSPRGQRPTATLVRLAAEYFR